MRPAFLALALFGLAPMRVDAQEPVVHAVLFYSPTCPHCHEVMTNVLPPLHDQYGDRLVIAGVDVTKERGAALYRAMAAHFQLPESRLGVPALLVGLDLMVGSGEIPERFPGIIERGLAEGGIDWPPIEEIREALTAQGIIQQTPAAAPSPTPPVTPPADTTRPPTGAAAPPPADTTRRPAEPATRTAAGRDTAPAGARADSTGPSPAQAAPAPALPGAGPAAAPSGLLTDTTAARGATPVDTAAAGIAAGAAAAPAVALMGDTAIRLERPTMSQLFLRDPAGNAIAVVVLLLLLGTLAWSVRILVRPGTAPPSTWPSWAFPVLGVVGVAVAAYLSYVELTGAQAVCGPVGDCNTVQQSAWSRLFGVLPVGVLGLAGYGGMLGAWVVGTWGPPRARGGAWRAAWVLAFAGTAFSAWLTFLEPFVIGATCAWCVTSAIVIALMLAAATARAARLGSS